MNAEAQSLCSVCDQGLATAQGRVWGWLLDTELRREIEFSALRITHYIC